jgi:hypothetical protein
MAVTIEAGNHQAWYKNRYGKKNDALPDNSKIQEAIPFQQKAKTGRAYVEPVLLRSAHGVTIKGGSARGTVYAYNDPKSPVMDEVEISGCEITLRDQIAVGAVAAAMGGDTSYGPIVDYQVMELMRSHRNYLEWLMLYGQSTIGVVSGTPSTSGSNKVVTLTAASWAPGIWARGEGMRIDGLSALGGTLRSNAQAYVVEAVDFDNRTITISGDSGDLGDLASGDVLVFRDADGTNGSFTGIDKVVTNTGSLHGIDAATYSLWRGNVKTVSSVPLTMGILHRATVDAVDRGLETDITWLVPTLSWSNLADNESALRRYAESTGREYKQGANKLTFYGANGGAMNVVPHSCVKRGEAFGITPEEWVRGGESDLVDTLPGLPKDQFFHNVPGYAGLEILNFSSMFLFCRKPSRQVKITGISPTGA